jgi:hypothetical protein
MDLPMKKIRINDVKNFRQYKKNPKKAPEYDLITGKIRKELSHKGLRTITQIYNANCKPNISLDNGKWAKS